MEELYYVMIGVDGDDYVYDEGLTYEEAKLKKNECDRKTIENGGRAYSDLRLMQ